MNETTKERVDWIAKNKGGRMVYKMTSKSGEGGYDSVTYEFASRKGAGEFSRSVSQQGLSKYAPSFCDTFKYARVTVFISHK